MCWLSALDPWREVEPPEGLHGKEKGFIYLGCVGLLEAGQRGKKGDFGKEGMHEGSDNWKEEKHTHAWKT
jgi:hypothetical protein